MTDNVARMILLAGFVAVFPIAAYHRIKARTGEPLDRRQEGWPILLTLRPLGIAFALAVIAYLINPNWLAGASLGLPNWARWLGAVFGACGSVLLIWTFRTLGHNLTDTVVTRRNATLVSDGPYRWVRHPFYVGFALAIVANTLVADNGLLGATGAGALLAIIARTKREEARLVERFGQDYREYMRRTGRFFPKLPLGR